LFWGFYLKIPALMTVGVHESQAPEGAVPVLGRGKRRGAKIGFTKNLTHRGHRKSQMKYAVRPRVLGVKSTDNSIDAI